MRIALNSRVRWEESESERQGRDFPGGVGKAISKSNRFIHGRVCNNDEIAKMSRRPRAAFHFVRSCISFMKL